jgi:hypothetical protein
MVCAPPILHEEREMPKYSKYYKEDSKKNEPTKRSGEMRKRVSRHKSGVGKAASDLRKGYDRLRNLDWL